MFHAARLVDYLDPLNPEVVAFTESTTQSFLQQTGDPVGSHFMAVQTLANLRDQQAAALAYFDVFWVFGAVATSMVVLVFLMKKSVAQKGAHLAAE
jgi:DHA2 family multidrug resistance protein